MTTSPPSAPTPFTPPRRTAGVLGGAARLLGWAALAGALGLGGAVLGALGLGWVALAGAATLVAVRLGLPRRVASPVPALAVALALPAAALSLAANPVAPSRGALIARPFTPADVSPKTYHRGLGPVLVDLRHFTAPPGSTTQISAQSDLSRVVVALPRNECFTLRVHYRRISSSAQRFLGNTIGGQLGWQGRWLPGFGNVLYQSEGVSGAYVEHEFDGVSQRDATLRAYGIAVHSPQRFWTRTTTQPDAPVLDLTLAGAAEPTVSDMPDDASPLSYGDGNDQWPRNVQPPADPGLLRYANRRSLRTHANHVAWEAWGRASRRWAKEQAVRYAGACATPADLASRWVPDPSSFGNGWNTEVDKPVQVNGLGQVRGLFDQHVAAPTGANR